MPVFYRPSRSWRPGRSVAREPDACRLASFDKAQDDKERYGKQSRPGGRCRTMTHYPSTSLWMKTQRHGEPRRTMTQGHHKCVILRPRQTGAGPDKSGQAKLTLRQAQGSKAEPRLSRPVGIEACPVPFDKTSFRQSGISRTLMVRRLNVRRWYLRYVILRHSSG